MLDFGYFAEALGGSAMNTYDIECKACGYTDEQQCDESPNFCTQCGSQDIDWYILEK
jgi:predicted Zn-ribbon and HTH transcriptional regulator